MTVAELEALYRLPATVPDRVRHTRLCAHCREEITGLWAGPPAAPGTHGAAPRFHADREGCALAYLAAIGKAP